MRKKCPHCHEETFGWRELLTLDSFTSRQCKSCHQFARNSGGRQLLALFAFLSVFLATVVLWQIVPSDRAVLLIPFAVILGATAKVFTASPVKAGIAQLDLSPFTPDPENDKAILIQGWNEDELHKILDDFVEQDLSSFAAFRIEIRQRSENCFALTFSEDIHPDEFISLINYLAYPFGFDLAGRSIIVAGKTTLSSDFDGLPKSFEGKKALLYLPEHDQDYDVVYLQTAPDVTMAKSGNEGVWQQVKDARLSSAVKSLSY